MPESVENEATVEAGEMTAALTSSRWSRSPLPSKGVREEEGGSLRSHIEDEIRSRRERSRGDSVG